MGIHYFKAGLIIIFSLFFVPVKAAMPKDPIAKWQLIRNDFYIDTNDFKIENEKINFWVKIGDYERTRLIIDCKNLIYRETFSVSQGLLKRNSWQPVNSNSTQYIISNQLCFLSKVEGFNPERNSKQPSWVKRIIFINKENKNEQNLIELERISNEIQNKKETLFIEE